MSDDEREDFGSTPLDEESWAYVPPPDTQSTHHFKIDGLVFDSKFDSGNLMDVERVGPYNYNLNLSRDCEGAPKQTNNKQWFHFSISGGLKGHTIQLTLVNIPLCKMYSFAGYAPCVAITPIKPSYTRLNTRVQIKKLDAVQNLDSSSSSNNGPKTVDALSAAYSGTPTSAVASNAGAAFEIDLKPAGGEAPKKKATTMCNMTFEYTFEVDSLLKLDSEPGSEGLPSSYTTSVFFSNSHPYPYSKLQKQLLAWDTTINGPTPCTSVDQGAAGSGAAGARRVSATTAKEREISNRGEIYFHRELLTYSLDGNRCDLLTISGMNGMAKDEDGKGGADASSDLLYEPMLDTSIPVPMKCQPSDPNTGRNVNQILFQLPPEVQKDKCCPETGRAKRFPKKRYVILSARVHPGEIPASHILHGALEFLLNKTDPRAEALRQNFVFVVVPMINPDGVVRGHSRADTTGQNLNRTYAHPSQKRHPTTFALKKLLLQLESTKKLALYVDIHAHANKKGMFFYGNAMRGPEQIQNLLYPKLVSMNSPYFEFQSCNLSEQNMNAVGKNGESKDTSSRVVLFKETGFIHSYTFESNYVCGTTLNEVKGLGSGFPGEETGFTEGQSSPKYTIPVFYDVGKGLTTALLDMYGLNPASRVPLSTHHTVKNVAVWIQRALVADAWEQVRKQSILQSGQSLAKEREKGQPSFSAMAATQFPEIVTTKATKFMPPVTVIDLSSAAKTVPQTKEDSSGRGNIAPSTTGSRKPLETATATNGARKPNLPRTTSSATKTALSSRVIPPPSLNSGVSERSAGGRRHTTTTLGSRRTQ